MSIEKLVLTVAAAALGAIATGAFRIYRDWRANVARKRAVAHALRGEMLAVLAVSKARDYETVAQSYLDAYAQDDDRHMPSIVDTDDSRPPYPVFEAHLSDIGVLGAELAEEVACVYTLWNSCRTDVRRWAAGRFEGLSPAEKAQSLRSTLKLWRDSCQQAEELAGKLAKL